MATRPPTQLIILASTALYREAWRALLSDQPDLVVIGAVAGVSELGALLGTTRSVVSAWERGHILPTLPNVFRLARALDTLAESLYLGLYTSAPNSKISHHAPHT